MPDTTPMNGTPIGLPAEAAPPPKAAPSAAPRASDAEKLERFAKIVEANKAEREAKDKPATEEKKAETAEPAKKVEAKPKADKEEKAEAKPEKKAKETEEEESKDPILEKRLATIAKREEKARAEVAKLEETVKAKEAEADKALSVAEEAMRSLQEAKRRPEEFFKKVFGLEGAALAPIAKRLYQVAAGLPLTKDVETDGQVYSLEHENRQLRQRLDQIERRMEEREVARSQEATAEAYRSSVRTYLAGLPEEFEHLRAHYEVEPDDLGRIMLETAAAIWEDEGGDDPPTPAEVAQRLEEETRARYQRIYGKRLAAPAAKGKAAEPVGTKKKPPTLTEKHLATVTERPEPPKTRAELEKQRFERFAQRYYANHASDTK